MLDSECSSYSLMQILAPTTLSTSSVWLSSLSWALVHCSLVLSLLIQLIQHVQPRWRPVWIPKEMVCRWCMVQFCSIYNDSCCSYCKSGMRWTKNNNQPTMFVNFNWCISLNSATAPLNWRLSRWSYKIRCYSRPIENFLSPNPSLFRLSAIQ